MKYLSGGSLISQTEYDIDREALEQEVPDTVVEADDSLEFYRQVRLVKRVIVFIFFSLLILAVTAAVVLGMLCSQLKNRTVLQQSQMIELNDQIRALEQAAAAPREKEDEPSPEEPPPVEEIKEPDEPSFEYQTMFPELYVEPVERVQPDAKTVYLTFDDGPSGNTLTLLDLLDDYGVKATFFVVGLEIDRREYILQEVAQRGHTIGVHTNTHRYMDIYSSVESFLADFEAASLKIEEVTGQKPTIFRFPGGSINSYNQPIYKQLIAEMLRRGYTFYDWNTSAQDAEAGYRTAQDIAQTVIGTVPDDRHPIVLMHDSNERESSVLAVPLIIEALSAQGYSFAALDSSVPPSHFSYTS